MNEETIKKFEAHAKKAQEKVNALKHRLWKFTKNLAGMMITYAITAGIMLQVYAAVGWEKTMVILLVGVIAFNIKARWN